MSIGERIKLIRGDKKISGAELGRILEMTRGNISKMEKSERVVTDRTISQICSTFNVNEHWLRTGEGEMYVELTPNDLIADFVKNLMKGGNEMQKELLLESADLTEAELEMVLHVIKTVKNAKKNTTSD